MKLRHFLLLLMSSATLLYAAESRQRPSIVLGGGCFWCTEGVYQLIPGVEKVVSGYAGGHVKNPTYKQICTGTTGHAEVIKVDYDPEKISFKQLVDLFWFAHDPTTLNYQGNDHGTQYRSVVYYENEEQRKLIEESKKEHTKLFISPIVTEISPLPVFYPAEDYHQNFANNNPNQGYVCNVVQPKIAKFKKKLAELNLTQKP